MSHDIYLVDPETRHPMRADTPHRIRGGTYRVDDLREAWLNVTYNYAAIFRRVLGDRGIRSLYGLTGSESVPILEAAIARLGDDVTGNCWDATEGNARRSLCDLLALARMFPGGVWDGD